MTEQLTDTPIEEAIRPEHIELSGGAQTVEAHTVSISQGGAGQIHADEVTITQGGVGLARAGKVELGEGGSAFAVIADEAEVKAGANVLVLLARTTSGDVRPLVDARAAIAIGIGFGIVISLLRRLR